VRNLCKSQLRRDYRVVYSRTVPREVI